MSLVMVKSLCKTYVFITSRNFSNETLMMCLCTDNVDDEFIRDRQHYTSVNCHPRIGSVFHEFMFIHESMDHVSKNRWIVILNGKLVSKFICFVLIYICVWTVHSVKCCSCQQAIQLSAESIAKFLLISFGSEWTLFRQISFGKFNVFQFRFKFMSTQWHVEFTWNCFCVILS